MEPRKKFTFPQEWKRKAVLFAIRTGHNNATIAKFFDLTTTWVWKVRNQLEKSGGDYEAVAKSDHLTKKFGYQTYAAPCTRSVQTVSDLISSAKNNATPVK